MAKRIRVLVVDDSGYVVAAVTRKLQAHPDIDVVGSAFNGLEALQKVKDLRPDVVTLDVVMPEMDGLAALQHIMAETPTPVVMLSALTAENAETTIRALEYGAVDFFLKPSVIRPAGTEPADDTLVNKILSAARTPVKGNNALLNDRENAPIRKRASISPAHEVVVIGASTGGPRALMDVVPLLPDDFPAAVLIVQHMPPVFTKSLADRLNRVSQLTVEEAQDGSIVRQGMALVAPGGYHMTLVDRNRVVLDQGPPQQGVRPAINPTMKSAAKIFGSSTLGVILTGMGCDGTEGALAIRNAGGKILAQDEATSAVYGMPMSVAKAGQVNRVIPLPLMAREIIRSCQTETKQVSAMGR